MKIKPNRKKVTKKKTQDQHQISDPPPRTKIVPAVKNRKLHTRQQKTTHQTAENSYCHHSTSSQKPIQAHDSNRNSGAQNTKAPFRIPSPFIIQAQMNPQSSQTPLPRQHFNFVQNIFHLYAAIVEDDVVPKIPNNPNSCVPYDSHPPF